MAQQAIAVKKDSAPTIHFGAPDDGIKQMFDSLARRAFSIFESNGRRAGNELADWLRAEKELFHLTHVNLLESNDAFTVRVEVPGFAANDLEINIEGRQLTISGKREEHEERNEKKTVYSETCSDQILRSIELPADVDTEAAHATLKDGILELELPKAAPAKKVAIASEKS